MSRYVKVTKKKKEIDACHACEIGQNTLYFTLNFCQVGLFGHEHLLSSLVRKQIDAKLNRDRGKINTTGALQKCWYLYESQ